MKKNNKANKIPNAAAGESGIMRKCKDCGKQFFISEQTEARLRAKGLYLFKRCDSCRKNRREAKNY